MPPKTNPMALLKLLYAKKESIFKRMQSISDCSSLVADETIKDRFLSSIETVDNLRSDFENILDQINSLELELNPDFVVNYDSLSSFEDLVCRIKLVAKSLQAPVVVTDSKPVFDTLKHDRPKLPSIQIPEFDGDIKNWPLFFASFETTIHKNSSLSDHEKLHYLVSKLTGKAKTVFAGITLGAENYSLILNTLKVKYEDQRLVATAYLDQIFNLKNISSCNEHDLEKFLDIFASAVRALKNLKVDNLCDFLFLYIGLKKLDSETVRLFEMDRRGYQIPKFDDLETFVRQHIRILQRTSSNHGVMKNNINRSSKPTKSTHTFVNLEPTTSQISHSKNCSLCKGQHDQLYKCSAFLKLTPSERYKHVRFNNLCINCLGDKHRVAFCSSNNFCRKCNGKHHSLLHFENNNVISNSRRSSASQVNSNNNSLVVSNSPPAISSNVLPSHSHALAAVTSQSPAPPPPRDNSQRLRMFPATSAADGDDAAAAYHQPNDVALCSLSSLRKTTPTTVLLATARVIVYDSHGRGHIVRALLDSASQSNFISKNCCNRLGLKINNRPSCNVVKGIGGSTKAIQGSVDIKFHSRLNSSISFSMDSLVVDKVTELLPTVVVNTALLTNFRDIPLADDTYAVPGDIDLLVGASIFPHLLLQRRIQGHTAHPAPLALETVLGFVIVGSAPARLDCNSTVSYCCTGEPLDSAVRKFWELEEVNVPPILSPDDKICEEFYSRTTTRDSEGRYIVALPFKGDVNSLGDSFQLAEKRLLCLERKMQASPKLREAYDSIIVEYLDKGFISLSPLETEETRDVPSFIIPHHGVIREDKLTTKLRIVLDGSAKTRSNVSLNDILYSGQNLQGNLFKIIVNFRLFAIALSADIRQMFLCIGVRESDRRFQRILYRFSPQEPLQVYEFNRVCFGLKSSPFHALRTVKQLAADEGNKYPKAKETIESGLYMDDYIYSLEREDQAVATATEVIDLMKAGHFDLVKWTSNSQVVLDSIPPSHRLSSVKEFDGNDTHKVLGLCWSPSSDMFNLKVSPTPSTCTKRTILSCIARIWDVMGFVAPVVLFAKLLIKELWLSNCDWDDTPPEKIVQQWNRFRSELPMLEQIKISRHVGISSDSIVTVLGFADASEKAYGGVVYFHVQNGADVSVHLISAKSKVAPSKVVSLARLELCAIFLLAQLISSIVSSCRNRTNINKIYAFSDSTVALCWTHSSPHRWGTFVANRVAKIQSELAPQNFYYVSGTGNPADCLSRGLTPVQILDHPLWFHGPFWCHAPSDKWPVRPFNPATVSTSLEEKKSSLVTTAPPLAERCIILKLASRVSSWSILLRSVVFICRFLKILPRRDHVTASDLIKAELLVLRELQRFYFSTEIKNLELNKPCSRTFQHLKPFLKDGIIRVGGRLSRSELNFDQMHPIVLPRKDHIVELIVEYHHKVYCHAGPDLLMAILRQKYWILSARNLIRSIVHRCIPCFKLRPKSIAPEMADHRACRVVRATKPFVHVGTDYAGPFRVTVSRGRGIRSTKAYICIFICMTTRAVHIELASDLSTPCFMAAFKRFLSRRGPVSRMYSDNGTNYVGARRSLSELYKFLRSKHFNTDFAHVLAENRIEWSFNTPAASHFGGDWESNIKSCKSHLFRVIGEQILTFEELSTVLTQVEAVMNTRPLCRILSSDPSEPLALTPAHFLNVTPLKYLPALEVEEDRLHLLSRHALLDKLVQSFWKRWRADYLHTLQSRQKWNTPSNPITVGTVVVIMTENVPPLHWPLGIVEEVFPGSNGITRIVRVKTTAGSYLRPVVRLCPLPNQQ